LILREILGKYSEVEFTIPEDIVDRIQYAKQGWKGQKDQPLLNIDATAQPGKSRFFCVCHPGWQESLETALEIVYTKASVIDMICKDRIYFFQAFNNITLERIHL